jgi:hypothetical protein
MKIITFLLCLTFSSIGFSAIVKSLDVDQSCTIYRVSTAETPIANNEVIVSDREVYGLTLTNMEINFETKQVLVDPTMVVVLGLNRSLLNQKVFISNENPDFNFLINQLNRKLFVLEKMCISDNNELVYASMFETK